MGFTRRSRVFSSVVAVGAVVAAGVVAVTVVPSAASAAVNPSPVAGARKSSTRLPFSVSGTAGLSVDVATRNVLFTDQLITLPGVRSSVPIQLWFNSSVQGTSIPSAVTGSIGSGWGITGFDQRLVLNSDSSVSYCGVGGLTGVFTPSGTGYVAPSQYQADLVKTGTTGWTLTDHRSRTVLTFTTGGRLLKSADRNGNLTTFNYTSAGLPGSVVSSRGAVDRTLNIGLNATRIVSLFQSDGSANRSVGLTYDSNGTYLDMIQDLASGSTKVLGADDGLLSTIVNPSGETTTIGSGSTTITQTNTAGAGTATTRLEYDPGQTLVADPTTDQASAVSAVAHTTYALTADGSQLVASATDPNGHARSATYTSLAQVKTATPAAGGTTSFSHAANNSESLTAVAAPGGATGSAAYTNTGANAYLPSSTTDDAGNALQYTYNGAGNQLSSAQGAGPQASVTYNSNGTPATSTSPGATVSTAYSYDGQANLSSITPPTGTSLGARSYAWDGFGRLRSAGDGRGNTISYSYDNADRITNVNYSDAATHDVAYSYDAQGQVRTRVDGAGTTSYTYDDLGRLLSVANTAGGATISYTYDLAGAVASETDAHGPTNYHYDPAHQLSYMIYQQGGGPAMMLFDYDNAGRRIDTWLQTNATHSVWGGHSHTAYDASGRVVHIVAQQGPVTAPITVLDQIYCYQAGTTPTGGCTASPSADRSNIQWMKNSYAGEASSYSYDDHDRLTKDVLTGGTNPRTYTFSYDPAGNRLTAVSTGTTPTSQSLAYNTGNQISSTGYTYDGAGNRSAGDAITASYNTAGQMTASTKAGATTNYGYAGANSDELLSEATTGGDSYAYAYGRADQNGLPGIEEVAYTHAGTTANAYVAHDNTGLPVLLTTSTGSACMYVYDGHNNPAGLVTNFGSLAYLLNFDPYGGTTVAQNSGGSGYVDNPYGYAGGIQSHTTQLIKFGARWYDPTTGAWTQQDTLNAPLDPHNGNRYVYAADNPINSSDPTGTCDGIFNCGGDGAVTGVLVGGVVGAIVGGTATGGCGSCSWVLCRSRGRRYDRCRRRSSRWPCPGHRKLLLRGTHARKSWKESTGRKASRHR